MGWRQLRGNHNDGSVCVCLWVGIQGWYIGGISRPKSREWSGLGRKQFIAATMADWILPSV